MRHMMALAALSLFAFTVAIAQAPTNSQQVSWTPPTKYTDGTPIPASVAVTYNLYAKLGSAPYVKIRSATANTTISSGPYPVGQVNCYQVSSIANEVEGARTAEACAPVRGLAPGLATTIVIQ